MRKVIFLSFFTFVVFSATAQVQTQVVGDSVFVHSNTSTGELILQNSTDTVPGFLFNKGLGRTAFRRAVISLGGNKYLIGADTLDLSGISSTGAWLTTGNTGTNTTSNFIGTTDNNGLKFKVNNGLAGWISVSSVNDIAFGTGSLPISTTTFHDNTAFGINALGNTTGNGNTGIGTYALTHNTTGTVNTSAGVASLFSNTTGYSNSAFGGQALYGNTTGIGNVAVGDTALINNTTGNFNIGFGYKAGIGKTTTSNTLYISDSTYHMYYKLDSVAGSAPNLIGKDAGGFWHVYNSPASSPLSTGNQTADYTLQLTDAGKLITQTDTAASSVTVPPNSSVAFPIGSRILVNQYGSGQVSIANGSGVVIKSPNGALKTSAQYGTVTLIKTATDTWILNGDLTNLIITYDVDAQKFIDSSGITDSVQKRAVNNLVKQLKDSSLWSSFMAIYPMVGGTSTTTKWNLKDPRNLDAAYRLTFSGSPTFANTGILFPTTSDYANTHLADNALPGYSNNSIGYYSRTQNTTSGYDIGCSDVTSPWNEFSIYYAGDATEYFGFHGFGVTPSVTKGLFMLSATASDVKRYDNGVATASRGSAPTTTFTNLSILIGSTVSAPAVGHRECALASIGSGLTDAQAATFYNIVLNFETTLGRN